MKVLRRANEPAPWAYETPCPRCKATLSIGEEDLCHCGGDADPFSVGCPDCGTIILVPTWLIPEDVRGYVAGRAARARTPGRVA